LSFEEPGRYVSKADEERWDAKYREGAGGTLPSPFIISVADLLPTHGRALDLAGGRGRHARWLARRGLDVTLADVSGVGLALAREEAAREGVSLETVRVDLEKDPPPSGPWDLVMIFHYLHRPLFAEIPRLLAPNGLFVFCQATERNLERHSRPPRGYLIPEGELLTLVQGLEVILYEEGWVEEGRHEARVVARKEPGS
jgi:SAM-dependent methyltransferase